MCVVIGRQNALLTAAESGQTEQVSSLLDAGIDVDYFQSNHNDGLTQMTALHWAALRGHVQTVRLLLARGASARARNNVGQTPLHLAANAGCKAEIVEMLLEKGANVEDKDSEGRNVFDYSRNSEECIQALYKNRMRKEYEHAMRQLEAIKQLERDMPGMNISQTLQRYKEIKRNYKNDGE